MLRVPIYQEQLTAGLLYQVYDPHIHSFIFSDMTPETVDAAYEKIVVLDLEYADKQIPIHHLYAVDNVPVTPYMLMRLKSLVNGSPSTLVETSAIVADSIMAKILENLLAPILNSLSPGTLRFIATEAEAFAWFDETHKVYAEEL